MITRRYVDAPWGQIHVADAGEGPAVLLLHQTPRSWDEFREVIELLSDHYRLLAMDLPGMGASDPHNDGASIESYAEAAMTVIDAAGLPSVSVCGHHTGGVVAIEVAARAGAQVSQVVLSSTPWVDAEARERRARKTPIDTIERDAAGLHLQSLWTQRAPYYPEGHHLLDRFVADALRADDPATGHLAVGRYRMEDRAPLVRCRVTVIEHSADPFSTRHTDAVASAFGAQIDRIEHGRVALEHTAPAFAEVLASQLASGTQEQK